jgi:5-methyltetrahydropteroyltriglutamate--homocysteine methyltransferase
LAENRWTVSRPIFILEANPRIADGGAPSQPAAANGRGKSKQGGDVMYRATEGIVLPTTIIGSLPRPQWYTENLGLRTFREAMVLTGFREQYTDAVSAYLRDQETAGLDICTDGDAHFDADVGGHSWFSYAPNHMDGFSGAEAYKIKGGRAGMRGRRGHILHELLEARIMPDLTGPVGRGRLQYTSMWKTAQRLTERPVKFGTITPELITMAVRDLHYKDLRTAILAVSDALNEELHELADAGCPAIQMEETQIHLLAGKGLTDDVLNPDFMVEVFNNTVKGLRDKTEVWCHTCWGNPASQRIVDEAQTYVPALEALNRVDADIVTFEFCSSGGADIEAIGEVIEDNKKVALGVIDHHILQVETPDQVEATIWKALKHIPAERLVVSSDCGMGREGMSRRHAYHKMVSLVAGTNQVRKELGVPQAHQLAMEDQYSLVENE